MSKYLYKLLTQTRKPDDGPLWETPSLFTIWEQIPGLFLNENLSDKKFRGIHGEDLRIVASSDLSLVTGERCLSKSVDEYR